MGTARRRRAASPRACVGRTPRGGVQPARGRFPAPVVLLSLPSDISFSCGNRRPHSSPGYVPAHSRINGDVRAVSACSVKAGGGGRYIRSGSRDQFGAGQGHTESGRRRFCRGLLIPSWAFSDAGRRGHCALRALTPALASSAAGPDWRTVAATSHCSSQAYQGHSI